MRKLLGALAAGVERLLSDPGAKAPTLKTGSVVVDIRPVRSQYENLTLALEAMLAPERVLPADATIPASRTRQINPYIQERYEPVPLDLDHLDAYEIAAFTANGAVPIGGWRVTQHVTLRRNFSHMTSQEIREHVLSLQQAPEDDALYNGYYPAIRGSDIAHHDAGKPGMAAFRGGKVLKGNPTYDANGRLTHDGTIRGGTEITGGRAQYKRATKGYEPFGPGHFAAVDKIKADAKTKREQETAVKVAKIDAKLPRKVGEL